LKEYTKDYKNQLQHQFQNQITQLGNNNFNINYNINQNINQNIQIPRQNSNNSHKAWECSSPTFNPNFAPYLGNQNFYNIMNRFSSSPNDSPNVSFGEENYYNSGIGNKNLPSVRPQPKRTNSSGHIDVSSRKGPSLKTKTSLFMSLEKEEKCDEFEDIHELVGSISSELWDYARSQKGSRNLQKLLNKIQPEELDFILEKIKDHFADLMVDTYGNYFSQKLIQCCSSEQRMFILNHVNILI
jgi:hypothetical protein